MWAGLVTTVVFTWFLALAIESTVRWAFILAGIVGASLSVLLLGWELFRRARRDTCTWAPHWRRLAQAPGWLLVVLGTYVVIGLAVMEIREKRVGLGTGTCVAVLGATIKGVGKWYSGRHAT